MRMVTIRHPKLDEQVEVPESSVPHHERAGWSRVEAKPAKQHTETRKPAEKSGESAGESSKAEK